MDNIVVVGSGASGVHFALTALKKGHPVTLLDVGNRRGEPPLPEASFLALREELDDPVAYFLGEDGGAVSYPGSRASYYGFPPSKEYVFRTPAGFSARTLGIEPSFSFARGGLAETWTAGAYEYGDSLLGDFPIGYEDLRPHYEEVARRIGVSGEKDDLAPFIPFEADYLPPLTPDAHTRLLLERYARKRELLRRRHGFRMGRSRVATLSRSFGAREGCSELGRCLWGCPIDAIYSPRLTLEECLRYPEFQYRSGLLVSHFEYADGGRVDAVVATPVGEGEAIRIETDRLVLAAGALCSTKIVLDSIYRRTGRVEQATGLMDNRQIHVPFLSFQQLGSEAETSAYQFHHLAFGLDRDDPTEYVHGQITTLKSASIHPIVQSLPLDLRTAVAAFRHIRAGLAVANVNLPDRRREQSHATIRPLGGSERTEMVLNYVSDEREEKDMRRAVRDVKRVLRRLGCFAPPGMTRVLPKGTSAHYAGTLPMSATPAPLATTPDGGSWDFPNLHVVDGAVLPFLPSVNHTFTLMANAVRVAEATLTSP